MRSFNSFIRILFYTTFLITGVSFRVVGQLKEDPSQFAESVRTLLKSTKKPEDAQLAENFISVWNGIGSAEKEKVISIAMKMQKKKYKVNSGFQHFFSGLVASISLRQINATELSKMLVVTDRVVDQFDSKATLAYLQTVKLFFEKQALYVSNYSTLYIQGGTYTFEFKDPPPPPPVDTTSMSLNDTTSSLSIDQQFNNLDQTNPDDWSSGWETTEGFSTDTSTTITPTELSTDNKAVNPLAFQQAQPTIEGPTIVLENVNLTFITHFDSVTLYNTKGSFLFKNNLFVGEGGKFDWAMAGMKEVFVEFAHYNFDVRKPKLEINDVKLTYPDKLDQPVEGIFEFESKRHQGTKDAQFPRFKSYRSDIAVKNIGRNILYKGGFTLAGRRIYSSYIGDGKALIQLSYNDQLKLRAYSSQFELADSVIRSSRAAVTIYHQQDTISHPGLQFRFNKMNQQLVLLKDEGKFKKTSYASSFFRMGFLADLLKWNIQTDSINLNILSGKSQAPAWFESEEYYNEAVFDNLKGLYTFHPLQVAVNYARKIGSSLFSIEDLATQYKLNVKQVRASMNTLMQQGFVDVDPIGDQVLIREKGYHYILARNNKKDYDNIIIPSVSPGKPNATIDLKKPELKINGIDRFYLSDSTNTYIEPVNKEIRIVKNRDFNFDGRINCGNFQFFGNDFRFDYDSFLVNMPIIDSIKFLVNTKERTKSGTFKKRLLVTQLELASGVLYINHPKNKSSRKNLPQYPIFDAKTGASVFFDRKEILNKAYDKSLQFQIPPFKIDSLSSSDPSTIAFNGIFKSNGLMPDFKEKLSVLPDYSLGFTHVAPPQGYPLYNTSARFYSYLTMNTHGLRGDGTISYLTTTLKSDSFTFFIDSVKTIGTIAQMKEGEINKITFPDAKVERYEMKWLAKKDSMYIANISDPIQLYKNTATLDGMLNISSQGAFGKGVLSTRGSETRSDRYAFGKNKYTGRDAYFEIKSSVADKPSFLGDSVKIQFDLLKNQAIISPEEEGDAALSFPYSQYKSSIKQAKWLLNEKKIVMSDSASDISNSYFYSTRKDQDSLVFNASGGEYDIQNSTLNIKGIPYIKVVDAKIIPPKGEVVILEDANIQPIAPARVLIDTTYEYHKLYNGSIEILSRYKFTGSAIYQFINAKSDTFDIKFDRFDFEPYTNLITKKQEKQTVAQGLIVEEDTFRIAPRIFYKGNVKMYATKRALELDGFVKLDLKKIPDYNEWIQYKRTDNVDQVLLDFDKHATDRGKKLSAGIHIESGANSLYTTFASDKRSAGDMDVFQAKGILSYQFSSNEFRIATPGKYKGETYEGTTFIYNEDFNSIKFDGKLQFAPGNPDVEVVATGSGAARTDTADFRFNTFMTLNFKFTTKGKGLEMMATDIKRTVDSVNVSKANSDFKGMLYNIANIVGDQSARDYESKSMSNYTPLASISPSFVKTMVFSDLNLKWSEEYKAWYSVGQLGLSNIDKYDINAKVNGYVEIRKGLNGGEAITVLLEVSPSVWYYFGYEEKRLTIFSSNDNFNRAVGSKAKLGRPGEYGVMLGSMMDELSFIQRFKAAYLGINRPIEEPVVPPTDQNDLAPLPDENKVPDVSTPPDSTDTNGF